MKPTKINCLAFTNRHKKKNIICQWYYYNNDTIFNRFKDKPNTFFVRFTISNN